MDIKAPKSVKPRSKRRAHLPKQPFQNIAVSLSGGGFRATCNHLGLMSYLATISLGDTSLLERVRILSSVSGGTFVGVKYASTLKKGGSFDDCYKSLVELMTKTDLVKEALEYLAEDSNWENGRQRSLINAFASIYHRDFEPEEFGLLWQESPEIHLKEISFNATEFHFALPFHFQKTEFSPGKHDLSEYTGNRKIHIPAEMAKEIRLADIIAASSCVPFGFEPINFPDDFMHEESVKLKDKTLLPVQTYEGEKINYPIGLMDGGVDDNQGVDAVISAEERMKNYPEDKWPFRSQDKKSVDLYIISDGTNPGMESYVRSTRYRIPYIGTWSFGSMRLIGISSFLTGCMLMSFAFFSNLKLAVIALSVTGTLGIVIAFVFLILSRGFTGLARQLGVPSFFIKHVKHIDRLKFGTLNNMLINRRASVVKMITKVSIKQMRWFGFERVYSDPGWKPRLIMNAIFELTRGEVIKRRNKYPFHSSEIIEPGEKIMAVSAKALTKGTTLWFSEDELKGERNMVNSIIACGQFTICFNLLEYYEKFLKNPKYQKDYEKYSPETQAMLRKLYEDLLADWRKFKEDPFWMVKAYQSRLWPK
jgi:predicted acylesterase/phospholipase RssA